MMKWMRYALSFLSARWLAPALLGGFAILYTGTAFFNDEALMALMAMVKESRLLQLLLLLVPVNLAARLAMEIVLYLRRRAILNGKGMKSCAGLFDEEVLMRKSVMDPLVQPISCAGYRVRRFGNSLVATRGIPVLPAQFFLRVAVILLFFGILLSVTGRHSERIPVIEGEQLLPDGPVVESIEFGQTKSLFFARTVTIHTHDGNGRTIAYGIYPPGRYGGRFLYPRYLGAAPLLRFSAPGFQPGIAENCLLMIHPAGREDTVDIPGTDYRIFVTLAEPASGNDPLETGEISYRWRVEQKGREIFAGRTAADESFSKAGYSLALSKPRKVVAADMVSDSVIPLIWGAFLLFGAALFYYLPMRFLFPRRELLFMSEADGISAYSRAEGFRRRHAGLFHETLDILERHFTG